MHEAAFVLAASRQFRSEPDGDRGQAPRRRTQRPPLSNRAIANALSGSRAQSADVAGVRERLGLSAGAGHVRVGPPAEAIPRLLGVAAVTVGNHILVRRAAYKPSTAAGRDLIAHELSHVAAHRGDPGTVHAFDPESSAPVETEAQAGVSAAALTLLDAEILRAWEASSFDVAVAKLGRIEDTTSVEWEFWTSVQEEPAVRAFHGRVALLLTNGQDDVADEQDVEHLVHDSYVLAASESDTIAELGEEPVTAFPKLFPGTWAARVDAHLRPPADLDVAAAAAALEDAATALGDAAGSVPADVYRQGLPVPFAAALTLRTFPFRRAFRGLAEPESLADFAAQAERWVKARVTYNVAVGWATGKQTLVADIGEGRKTVDPETWHLVSEPRDYQPNLDQLAEQALDEGLELRAVMDPEVIDGWQYELALAKLAAFVAPWHELSGWISVAGIFSTALAGADALVSDTDPEAKVRLADQWADNWNYGGAALAALTDELQDNVGGIAGDIALDVFVSALPVVGWVWRGKEAIEEAVDLYQAFASVGEARDMARSATTAVALQRAAAQIVAAEYARYATVGMTAVSEGVSFGARRLAKGTATREPDSGTKRGEGTASDEPELARPGSGGTASPTDAAIAAALHQLRSDFPVLNDIQLSSQRIARVIRATNDAHAKGQLLEELMSAQVHQRLQTPEGRAGLDLSEAPAGQRIFIEGHRVKLRGKQVTDGIIGYYDAAGVFRIEAVLEAKAGKAASKGLATSSAGVSGLSAADKRQLFREIHEAAEDDVYDFLKQHHEAALDALVASDYGRIPDEAVDAVVKNETLRKEAVASLSESGQIRRDIERLAPSTGPDMENIGPADIENTVLDIEDIGDVEVSLSPTRTRFVGVVPSDVEPGGLASKVDSEFQFSAENLPITSAELQELVTRLRNLAPLLEPPT